MKSFSRHPSDRPLRVRDPVAARDESEARASTPQEVPPALVGREATSGAPSAGRGHGFLRRHGRAVTAVVGVAAIAGFIQFVVPQLSALGPTLHRLRAGDPKWLGFGVVLEALSLGGYIALFRTIFSCHGVRIGWKASYQITMAGVVATKLFAAAGAGAGCCAASAADARRRKRAA